MDGFNGVILVVLLFSTEGFRVGLDVGGFVNRKRGKTRVGGGW